MDAVPGRLNQMSVFINRNSIFYGQCSESCGVNHAFMPIQVVGLSPSDFLSNPNPYKLTRTQVVQLLLNRLDQPLTQPLSQCQCYCYCRPLGPLDPDQVPDTVQLVELSDQKQKILDEISDYKQKMSEYKRQMEFAKLLETELAKLRTQLSLIDPYKTPHSYPMSRQEVVDTYYDILYPTPASVPSSVPSPVLSSEPSSESSSVNSIESQV